MTEGDPARLRAATASSTSRQDGAVRPPGSRISVPLLVNDRQRVSCEPSNRAALGGGGEKRRRGRAQAPMQNRLNGPRQPKSLLSGLVFCGCCGGPYSLRGADRFACSNHISKGTCSNGRTIPREELEARVLAGLKDRMMAPEIVEGAMRTYAQETNRLNWERRSNGDAWKAEMVKVEKQIRGIIEAIKAGMFHESMKAEMDLLESRKTELNTLLAEAPKTRRTSCRAPRRSTQRRSRHSQRP